MPTGNESGSCLRSQSRKGLREARPAPHEISPFSLSFVTITAPPLTDIPYSFIDTKNPRNETQRPGRSLDGVWTETGGSLEAPGFEASIVRPNLKQRTLVIG